MLGFQNESGKYEYRYLFVQLDSYPHTTIIIEDNRLSDPLDLDTETEKSTPTSIFSWNNASWSVNKPVRK